MAAIKAPDTPAAESIDAILRLEKEEEDALGPHHRFFHAIGSFVGTVPFLAFQCVAVALWVLISHYAPDLLPDEYPFPLLAAVLALEGGSPDFMCANPPKRDRSHSREARSSRTTNKSPGGT
jgi:hypothetical protein